VSAATRLQRVVCLLAVGVMLATLGALSLPHAAAASSPSPAAIDIGSLFGNENEPDENEVDEGAGKQPAQSSGTSKPVLIALALLAALVAGYALIRIRRLWLRVRGWGRDMRARL
jgi:hypothetical protein